MQPTAKFPITRSSVLKPRPWIAALALSAALLFSASTAQAGGWCFGGGYYAPSYYSVGYYGAGCYGGYGYGGYGYGVGYGAYDYGCYYPAPVVYPSVRYGCFGPLPSYSYYSAGYYGYGYTLPPVYEPAELYYGPQAVKQFMGVSRDFAIRPLLEEPAPVVREVQVERRHAEIEPRVREFNWQAEERAQRFLELGDGRFQRQDFQGALQHYKSAAAASTDSAEAYYRQAVALIATNRLELATAALRRAVAADANPALRLDSLYGDNRLARRAHLEALAAAALEEPENGEYWLLVGTFLRLDGQFQRADRFLARAAELGDATARRMLPAAEPDAPLFAGRDT